MASESLEFAVVLAQEFPQASYVRVARAARGLMRYGRQHSALCVDYCNGAVDGDQYEATKRRIRKALAVAAADLFGAEYDEPAKEKAARVPDGFLMLSGDPRGSTVKIKLPSGRSNSFGGEGWCVPNS